MNGSSANEKFIIKSFGKKSILMVMVGGVYKFRQLICDKKLN